MLLDPRPAGRGILLQQHLGLHKGRETVVVVGFGLGASLAWILQAKGERQAFNMAAPGNLAGERLEA